jgi:CO/xanthine dehydrogenase Mo-binding subunit
MNLISTTSPSVGASQARPDAVTKVMGHGKFAADYYGPRHLWAGVRRAGIPHGRLISVSTKAAEQIPGVKKILTHKDVKGSNRQGVIQKDQPVLVDDRIRHCGDALALVIAETPRALETALALITFEYEALPGIFTTAEALKDGAPLIHPSHPGGNCLLSGQLVSGKGLEAFEECDAIVEFNIDLPRQEHAYLETECGEAVYEKGELSIVVSTQTPFRDRAETAQAVGISPEKLRIIAPYCGGGFGGKDGITVQSLLGLAAMACPDVLIKMMWSREESFLASPKRHAASLHYRLGAKQNGAFHALNVRADFDTGPYDHLGGAVLGLALEHAGGPYRIPHASIRGRAVYTNNTIGGAFRGFGVPQVAAAMEQAVDLMAKKLSLAPLDIRMKNAVQKGDKIPSGTTLKTSTGIRECLARLKDHPLYQGADAWKKKAPAHMLRGAGMACALHGMGYGPFVPDTALAKLELTTQGRFKIYFGVVDMGQGNGVTFLQMAGDLLNQNYENLELVLPDTGRTLPCGSASASRSTYTFGNALIQAVETMKTRLTQRAADSLMVVDGDEFCFIPGGLRHLPTGREFPLAQLAALLSPEERVTISRYRAPASKETVTTDTALQMHGIPHTVFSYTAHLAHVEIDTLTGGIMVCNYAAVTDCGRLINPDLYQQQMQGGIAQGLGYALYEDFITDKGRLLTANLSTYIIPGALDIPSMTLSSVDLQENTGPFGMKGVGEVCIDPVLPAVANAVADACGGGRCRRWPLTGERMLEILNPGPLSAGPDMNRSLI